MNDQARKLALLGLTNEEMAEFFGVSERTLYRWLADEPAFCQAVNDGKTVADANVADSLYKRATGEHVQMEKVVKGPDGQHAAIKYMTYIPGDAGAALNWLKNRRRQNWQDKVDHNHSGTIDLVNKEQRDAAVAAAIRADS
ncbi:MAG: antitoxin Xre-like helix-turn-helix domain-containing protein [Armatimonadia bacterium]|nr:terminase [Betaproteobacteria bacterium]